MDLHEWRAHSFAGKVDLFAGGVPCPPFSRAGQQLGPDDERDLFPTAMRLIRECRPRAVLLENVRGLLSDRFGDYRREAIEAPLEREGYAFTWALLEARDFGVPQLRPRALLVAMRPEAMAEFNWPTPTGKAPTVGQALKQEMGRGGWKGAREWAERADGIAPTLVGGSKKHGGPDLGPTQAKRQWASMGVNAHLVAESPPGPDHQGAPHLTVRMAAILQGFPPDWPLAGKKTNAYRQVGNAFPPPVAQAVGRAIAAALSRPADHQQPGDPTSGIGATEVGPSAAD